jgi:hypothetical protein
MPTPTTTKGLFAALTKMADEIVQEKQAAHGKAAAPTPADPGQIGGSSSHPTASVDNGCQPAKEGERSSENTADVKKQQREPSVDSTTDAKPGDDKDNSLNIGMTASLTGEDPSIEDDYKDKKDDPGTSHPADVSDNEKYGKLNLKQASTQAMEIANSLLADIGLGYAKNLGKTAAAAATAAQPAAAAAPAGASPKTAAAPAAAMLAGYDLATGLGLNKTAAEAQVASIIENSIKEAHERADLFGGFITKLAADEQAAEGEDHAGGGGAPEAGGSGAGDAEGAGGPSGGAGGGGGGGGIESMLGGGGGAPPPPGGDPMGGGAMGGGGQEAALQELVAALAELGITPEQLAQAGQAAGGGGGGMGGDPMGGGAMPPPGGDPLAALGGGGGAGGAMPPPADPMMGGAPPAGDPMKVAMLARNFMRSGRYQVKEARTKEARQLRDQMKRMIIEMVR